MVPSPAYRGVTLIEMVVVTTIMLLLAMSLGNLDALRLQIERRIRQRVDPDHQQAALALLHITKTLELADRVNFIPASKTYQIRRLVLQQPGVPYPGYFDMSYYYHWGQYTLVDVDSDAVYDELWFWNRPYMGGCGTKKVLAEHIVDLSMTFVDAEPVAPPGGETTPLDNNVVEYMVTWGQGNRRREFRGMVTMRASGYTDVPTGLQNPGLPDASPPPPLCT